MDLSANPVKGGLVGRLKLPILLHLHCFFLKMEHYWDIDFDSREFECPDNCVVYFQLD